ncbi:MAG TPA: hypothetical protein VM261_26295 [Kofleriaceae bacterium]|nr:hypothetical protein [Kofleriaceae bacterium]
MSIYVVKSQINQAREQIQRERIDDLERTLAGAEGTLARLTDIDKTPILAEIAALRIEAAAMVQPEEKLKLSGARGKLRQAREYVDKGYDPADTAKLVVMVEDFLVHVRDQHKAKEVEELAAIKAKLAPAAPAAVSAPVQAIGTAPVAAVATATVDDKAAVDNFTFELDTCRRGAERDARSFADARKERSPRDLDPGNTAQRLATWVERMRNASRAGIGSERGLAALADADRWAEIIAAQIAELTLFAEACDLFRAEAEVDGRELAIGAALDSVDWNFSRDPERVIIAWDAAKKLIASFEQPRFAQVPEVQAIVARYHETERRIEAELRPLLDRLAIAPLLQAATYPVERLRRAIDSQDEEGALAARRELRAAMVPLERYAADADVDDLLRKAGRAMRQAETDFGDGFVLREIQHAESVVRPLVERVERAVVLASAFRIREHAPRLIARLGELAPFLAHQRAQILEARARAALAKIETAVGASIAREVAVAEAVPRFAVDITADTKVQAALRELDAPFARYEETQAKARLAFEAEVDCATGSCAAYAQRNAESAAEDMIDAARRAEELADALRRLDRNHPAVAATEDAVPALVKRAQAWKRRAAQRCAYAGAIYRARTALGDADRARQGLTPGDAYDAARVWPEVLRHLRMADTPIAGARAELADDCDEADALAAEVAAMRTEAADALGAACLAEATRLAIANDASGAERSAQSLRDPLPDAPQNAQIAAAIAGTADARQRAEAEIAAGGELIRARAETAAQTLRPAFDAWAEARAPITVLGGSIVADLDKYRGQWIRCHARHLGRLLYDHHDEVNGDMFLFEYEEGVREALLAGMKRLDDLYERMAKRAGERHGVDNVPTSTQHYPRDAHYLAEIVGLGQYTPQREVRDNYGRLLGTVDGAPYPVPRVVIRGVATTYFVVVPGHAPSLDAMDEGGVA